MKIYCKKCKYYDYIAGELLYTEQCGAVGAIREGHFAADWVVGNPEYVNQNNDCTFFVKKESFYRKIKKLIRKGL